MPEYLPVLVVGVAIALLAAAVYYAALVRPEPGPHRYEAAR
ncbi:hypothetical protein [Nocardia sp. CY41]|nr:hypothetical protein [Nocardia sp. CY41]